MKLRSDPYQIFQFSKTPAGLYARQKWLGEVQSGQWKNDFQETVDVLLSDQSPDGSWHQDTAATLKHLFGLHLTVRSANAQIEAAQALPVVTSLAQKYQAEIHILYVLKDYPAIGASYGDYDPADIEKMQVHRQRSPLSNFRIIG